MGEKSRSSQIENLLEYLTEEWRELVILPDVLTIPPVQRFKMEPEEFKRIYLPEDKAIVFYDENSVFFMRGTPYNDAGVFFITEENAEKYYHILDSYETMEIFPKELEHYVEVRREPLIVKEFIEKKFNVKLELEELLVREKNLEIYSVKESTENSKLFKYYLDTQNASESFHSYRISGGKIYRFKNPRFSNYGILVAEGDEVIIELTSRETLRLKPEKLMIICIDSG